jgi:hypothetical protein
MLLLIKNYINNLLIKTYMQAVRLRNIIANKILDGQSFIRNSVNTFIYCQHINALGGQTWTSYTYSE